MSIDPTPWPPYSQQVIFPPGASDAEICTAVLKGRPEFRPQPPWFLGFVVGFMVAYQLYWLVSVVWFYRLRKKHLRIRMRNFPLVVFQSVLVEWVLIFGPLRDATDPRTWSCDAVLWLRLLYMAVVIVPINLRIFNHYAQYRLQTLVARSKLVALEDGVPHPSAGEDHLMTIQHTSNASETTDSNQRVTFDMLEAQAAQLSFWFNFACTVVAFIPFLIITGIIAAVYPQYNRGCVGCTLSYVEYLASNLGGFVLAPLSLKALLVMKDKPDPLGFMSEMNLTLSVSVAICFPAMFLLSFDAWTGITVTGQFNWEWVNFLGASALHFFAVPYQIWIVTRRFHGGVNLRENLTIFLAIPKARGVFMQHLVHEFAVENLRGWEEIEAWKSQYTSLSLKNRVLQARRLYYAFIPSSAFLQLNISDKDRTRLQLFFAQEDDEVAAKLTPGLFDDVMGELLSMMAGSFERFERTTLFKQGQAQILPTQDV